MDPSLARWFEQAASRDAAINGAFVPVAETLLGLFTKKKYRLADGELFFAAWNGESNASSVVNISCGSPSPETVDLCVLTPPAKGDAAERLLSAAVLTQVMSAMVLAWDPDWGVFTSDNHRDDVSEFADTGTFVGWGTYLSRNRGKVPPLPSPVRIEPVADKGTLIILTPERFTVSNPEHVALAERVRELLDQAGLLKPLHAQP
nr:immunity 52 family protein [Myxococcus llanfairpwllgwyngyllgogerychwyrndrobwllllantysiliogogogochensis]